tara:strand:- start:295 stop:501 length:207 start_codon:yes stop_codon:yes gene_type:complete
MKNLIKYGFIAFVICFLLSCKENKESRKESIDISDKLRIGVFDGCEYVFCYDKMAHKGNCKNPIHNCR